MLALHVFLNRHITEALMKRRFFALLLSFVSIAGTTSAHGDKKHVLGIIEKINPDSVTVKTRDGKSVEVKLVASTVYISRVATTDKSAAFSDLAVGENVVIHATPKGDQLEAAEIKFSAAGASRPSSPKSQP
jgi:hypothetical protein